MNERAIRNAASMYALVAEMESIKAAVETMKIGNIERENRGESLAYGQEDFGDLSEALYEIASRLRREI